MSHVWLNKVSQKSRAWSRILGHCTVCSLTIKSYWGFYSTYIVFKDFVFIHIMSHVMTCLCVHILRNFDPYQQWYHAAHLGVACPPTALHYKGVQIKLAVHWALPAIMNCKSFTLKAVSFTFWKQAIKISLLSWLLLLSDSCFEQRLGLRDFKSVQCLPCK